MKIGFGAPCSGSWATPANMVRIAERAEQLGYHSLWTFQRLLFPAEGSLGEMYRSVHDPLITLAYLAGRTSTIRLGVAVINMSFISPVILAKQFASLDVVSGGRLDAGLGIGWNDAEFIATGATKERAGKRSDEYIQLLRKLWTEEVIEHEGEFYRVPASSFAPKPAQTPHPPILIGAKSPPALRRAGRLADGWVASSQSDLRVLGESAAIVKDAAAKAGRDPDSLRLICRGSTRVRPPGDAERRPLSGSFDEIRADIAMIAEQGMTELFLDLNFDPEIASPDADAAKSMDLAEQLLEEFCP
ncbi:MAG TPA: LLM class F420-dependent oxidoreductase [Micromonosporaceae bacterium]|nr:LLM class F420-dependent oxidoreductase [Micromonosporaceae bacterium]